VTPSTALATRHGWTLMRAAAFAETFDALEADVASLAAKDPEGYVSHPKAKLLRRIVDLILDEIPRDPNALSYQLGNTLGPMHRHWRRAKFLQRFRLFFRFDSAAKIIIYAWVNDETTLRKAGSRNDPYAVFLRRLEAGDPPDDWAELLAAAKRNP
jgi:toxin YhaV